MMTAEQNALLTETGPGAPMGELFRRYWIPALLAEELPGPDCPPVRVRLLSERLIAFRDSAGRVGLMDEFCAHRGISLWFGRNEEGGLRCPYHGWKYDVTGQCIDVPSEPEESGYCRKIKLRSYPCIEAGGAIFAYMGPPAEMPPPRPSSGSACRAPMCISPSAGRNATISRPWRAGSIRAMSRSCIATTSTATRSIAIPEARSSPAGPTPPSRFSKFAGGLLIGARRPADPGRCYWRVTQWLMPFYTLIPPYQDNALNGHAFVPMDDRNCMVWTMTFHPARPLGGIELELMQQGAGVHAELIAGTFQPIANRGNDYLIDRAAQAANLSFQRGARHRDPGRGDPGKHRADPGPHRRETRLDRQCHHHGAGASAHGRRGRSQRAGGRRDSNRKRSMCGRPPSCSTRTPRSAKPR